MVRRRADRRQEAPLAALARSLRYSISSDAVTFERLARPLQAARGAISARAARDGQRSGSMASIFYIIGVIVVVVFILSFLGLR